MGRDQSGLARRPRIEISDGLLADAQAGSCAGFGLVDYSLTGTGEKIDVWPTWWLTDSLLPEYLDNVRICVAPTQVCATASPTSRRLRNHAALGMTNLLDPTQVCGTKPLNYKPSRRRRQSFNSSKNENLLVLKVRYFVL